MITMRQMTIQMMILKGFFFLFPFILFAKEPICVFTPPENFLAQSPDRYPPFVKIAFSGTEEKHYHPTINLAIEKNSGPEKEFLECVEKLQKKKARSKWKKLQSIETLAGRATLFEDEYPSSSGTVKIYQAILVKDDTAYLLTGCSLKKDTQKYFPLFKKSFHSLSLTDNLLSLIKNETEKDLLIKEAEKVNKKSFKKFQDKVKNNFAHLGSYWQILYLKQTLEKTQ